MQLSPERIGLLLLVLVNAILSTGCEKMMENSYQPDNTGITENEKTGNSRSIKIDCGEVSGCAIRAITAYASGDTIHSVFAYNRNGSPATVRNDQVGTGNPNQLFKYDQYNRLIEYGRPYNNGFYEAWHKYGYNRKDQIVRDTMYSFGAMADSSAVPETSFVVLTDYTYDILNRIIRRKDSTFYSNSFVAVDSANFQYDGRGNLIRAGVVYDNKASILRTNKIWMFIACDYSVSNPFRATAYNFHGLPLSYTSTVFYENSFFLIYPFYTGIVEYICENSPRIHDSGIF